MAMRILLPTGVFSIVVVKASFSKRVVLEQL